MKKPRDLRNLTPRRALPLLVRAERALGKADRDDLWRTLRDVSEALSRHVERGLDKPRRRR